MSESLTILHHIVLKNDQILRFLLKRSVDQARNERREALSMILQERKREDKFEVRFLLDP